MDRGHKIAAPLIDGRIHGISKSRAMHSCQHTSFQTHRSDYCTPAIRTFGNISRMFQTRASSPWTCILTMGRGDEARSFPSYIPLSVCGHGSCRHSFKQASGLCLELVLISVAILAQGCKLTEVDFEVCSEFKSMQPAMKPDAKRCKSIPVWKPKGTVAIALTQSSQTADPPCTKPQYGLPTDGGAGGSSTAGASSAAAAVSPVNWGTWCEENPENKMGSAAASSSAAAAVPSAQLGSAAASSSSAGPPDASSSPAEPSPPSSPVALEGDDRRSRKQSRDQLRAEARKLKKTPPASYNPQGYLDVPPLCNRIASPWGEKPAECLCGSEWPKFFSAALSSGQLQRIQSTDTYHGTLTCEPGIKPCASYRRPGGHNMTHRWWYNAVVEGLMKVTDKSGHTKAIAIVN